MLPADVRHARGGGQNEDQAMKGIIAWLLGVPIVVIVLFYVTGIF